MERDIHLLIVDDEPELVDIVGEYFAGQGCTVHAASGAAAARAQIAANPIALAVLDIRMPGEDGLSLARWIRQQHPQIGIVMLTTAADVVDRVVGLEMGADDYIGKPFDLRELLARVKSVLRRRAAIPAALPATGPDGVGFGRCRLHLSSRKLLDAQGQELPITAMEFDLLRVFAERPNRVLNRDELMALAHHRGWDVYDRSIDLRIMRLRRKIELDPEKPEVIKTVRGVGYMYVARVQPGVLPAEAATPGCTRAARDGDER